MDLARDPYGVSAQASPQLHPLAQRGPSSLTDLDFKANFGSNIEKAPPRCWSPLSETMIMSGGATLLWKYKRINCRKPVSTGKGHREVGVK
jgi:hypothetical protein